MAANFTLNLPSVSAYTGLPAFFVGGPAAHSGMLNPLLWNASGQMTPIDSFPYLYNPFPPMFSNTPIFAARAGVGMPFPGQGFGGFGGGFGMNQGFGGGFGMNPGFGGFGGGFGMNPGFGGGFGFFA